MNRKDTDETSACHDAAVAAAAVMLEEFFPHCPNGIAQAIHERLCEIMETAFEAACAAQWHSRNKPSDN